MGELGLAELVGVWDCSPRIWCAPGLWNWTLAADTTRACVCESTNRLSLAPDCCSAQENPAKQCAIQTDLRQNKEMRRIENPGPISKVPGIFGCC